MGHNVIISSIKLAGNAGNPGSTGAPLLAEPML